MKKFISVLIITAFTGLVFWSCGSDDSSTEPDATTLTCKITSPLDTTGFFAGDTVRVTVDANDEDASIKEVRFKLDEIGFWSDDTYPYTAKISTDTLAVGGHIITAIAENDKGKEIETKINFGIRPENPSYFSVEQINVYSFWLSWAYTWDDETEEVTDVVDGFKIERKIDDGNFTQIAIAKDIFFVDSTLINKSYNTVYYQVRAYKEIYNSDYVASSSNIYFPAPSNLYTTPMSVTSTKLTWNDNSIGEDIFEIERKLSSDTTYVKISEVQGDDSATKSWSDSNLDPTEIYDYRVRAVKKNISSLYITKSGYIPFRAPENLKITQTSITAAKITWNDLSIGEDKFTIERKLTTESDFVEIVEITGDNNATKSWIDTSVIPSEVYDYRIKAVAGSFSTSYISVYYQNSFLAPTSLSYTILSPTTIRLDWIDNSKGEDGFKIDRKIGEGSWEIDYASVNSNIETWEDVEYDEFEIFYYRVRAYFTTYYSDYTTELQVIPRIIEIQGGTFAMGSVKEDPIHSVTLSDFIIGKYEVTQSEWSRIMGYNPCSTFGVGDNYPVYYISWYEIIKYCNLRSIAEGLTPCYTISSSTDPAFWGAVPTSSNTSWNAVICNWSEKGYRLPSEAEWEYAARGGINNADNYLYSGSDTLDVVGWYDLNSYTPTHIVGRKSSNQLGTYDMSGNVCELVWDWKADYTSDPLINPYGPESGTYRVSRGGDRISSKDHCQVDYRGSSIPYAIATYVFNGFRIARSK